MKPYIVNECVRLVELGHLRHLQPALLRVTPRFTTTTDTIGWRVLERKCVDKDVMLLSIDIPVEINRKLHPDFVLEDLGYKLMSTFYVAENQRLQDYLNMTLVNGKLQTRYSADSRYTERTAAVGRAWSKVVARAGVEVSQSSVTLDVSNDPSVGAW